MTPPGQARLGLCGLTGSGKSTTARLLVDALEDAGCEVVSIKLAEPLYEMQSLIYALCGRPLPRRYVQDGALLAFLGSHVRKIDAEALTRTFRLRLDQLRAPPLTRQLVLCDDVRAPDAAFLKDLGFVLVQVHAPEEVRRRRLSTRGNLSEVPERHPTESGLDAVPTDATVENSGSVDELQAATRPLVEMLLRLAGEEYA